MNRTVSTIIRDYVNLVPAIEKALKRNDHVYLVCDDGFTHDAQIWTPAERRTILANGARNASRTANSRGYRAELQAANSAFDNSRQVFHISRADLAEIKSRA